MPQGSVRQFAPGTGWRRRTASGVVLTAMAVGIRHTVDERSGDEAIVIEAADDLPEPGAILDLHFDARGPDDTWVVVKPWLLHRRPG